MDIPDLLQTPTDIVEHIMAQHWDVVACPCWICVAGRRCGCQVRERHLPHRMPRAVTEQLGRVEVQPRQDRGG